MSSIGLTCVCFTHARSGRQNDDLHDLEHEIPSMAYWQFAYWKVQQGHLIGWDEFRPLRRPVTGSIEGMMAHAAVVWCQPTRLGGGT